MLRIGQTDRTSDSKSIFIRNWVFGILTFLCGCPSVPGPEAVRSKKALVGGQNGQARRDASLGQPKSEWHTAGASSVLNLSTPRAQR
eukprot:8730143-Prorocentrum_lima.AAC.1